ncbi:unnamed protein product, partial [Mesorhabditis belari]|uniref:RRM domain-containing protein n=1 Tax=Mesorhabditis belari TaxID=2138241 RepID=A0AAF3J5Q4_9BILA
MGTTEQSFRVLQVSNISPQATKDQVNQLFTYLGRIQELKLYPTDQNMASTTMQKFAFIKFDDEKAVELGQHLTNTVLIDRALVCVPSIENTIPDEQTVMSTGGPAVPGQRNLPPHLINRIETDSDGHKMNVTIDPMLEQLGLPPYPPLPENTEMGKIEEIRRTVYVGNLPKGVTGQDVIDFFNMNIGEVMYVRMTTGPETLPCAYAFVEFSAQSSVIMALQNNMVLDYEGRLLKIQHSRVAIIKPQRKTADQAVEEIEEAIRKKETGLAYMAARSRSRSTSKRREAERERPSRRSRTPPRRRSRSRDRRSPSRSRRREPKRSRSRDRDRERERERKRSRSRDRDRRSRRSRSKDRDRKRSRSRSKDRERKRSRSRSKERSDRKRDKEKKEKERKKSRSRSPKRKESKRDRDRSPERKKKKEEKIEKKTKNESTDSEGDEEKSLREKLLEKAAHRKSEDDGGSTGDQPTKISNQRKRRDSDSD